MNSTIDYYNSHTSELVERYNQADVKSLHRLFDRYILSNHTVLDLGFGSGRDLLYLQDKGVQIWGNDGSTEFVERFKRAYPALEKRIFHSILPEISLPNECKAMFDAVISIATIIHIPKEEHFEIILNLKKYLKPKGMVILSYSTRPRMDDPRFFESLEPNQMALLFESFGFSLVESLCNNDGLGRENIEWVTQVFRLEESSQKGIDQIESILSQDSKDTTYKFALLKAFAQIASTPLNRFAHFSNDYVFFPIGLIAEKWIEMYWKLMDSPDFIPQKKGGEVNKKLAFRPPLEAVIAYYKIKNGLNPYYEFWSDMQSGVTRNSHEYTLLVALLNSVIKTIIDGPIAFSGSSFDDTQFFILGEGSKTFSKYHSTINAKNVLDAYVRVGIKKNAYHELYRYGTWISDSITLRWAKFTEKLTQHHAHPKSLGGIISKMSVDYVHDRETQFARKLYDMYQNDYGYVKSVWSAEKISQYEVDHVLPYAVYGNNDLWNLMPAKHTENNAKRDALVSTDLVKKRRYEIIEYWEYTQDKVPLKFNHEVYKSLKIDPLESTWKDRLLLAVCEQIEITASMKGLKRWGI